ncbi:MAG: VTC domain-containing protein [Anaerolineae bacterium]|jgi:hypothetical protein|nr:VTC domain-containing protein [Anaerolineae bacterium]MBT7072646.1 VTC domain-containing protein [Anaerolineae bacterium]MBT7991021.1 VTC domain-containing protein [Anaerolineae bacterium]
MNTSPTIREYRYERKFRVEDLDDVQVRMLVKRHPSIFYSPYPPRYINNLYLDTLNMGNYHANVSGVGERQKARIRWYGDLFGKITKPVLEFKVKDGLVGAKYSYPFPTFSFDTSFSQKGFQKLIANADLPDDVRWQLRGMSVVLCNRYYRWYYVTKDEKYRVTVDKEMRYYHIRQTGNHFRHQFLDPKAIVVELKYARELDPYADKIAGFFPFIITRNSKYITGIEQVYQ